ncbi:hypothetical protein BGZ72_004435 [Mortierella alpina]|nr:hypothetical protein BGZ72_004435 [Mortierella alpina]
MLDLSEIYKELLAADEGDILVKLKNGKQLKVISYLIKKRSPVFKSMLDASMQESSTGVIDLSSQYSLEAFNEFMAFLYFNKLYTGSYVPLLFEILCIADYYEIDAYKTYINDRIVKLITDVPICLIIAFEALKHGTVTSKIYSSCLAFLVEALQPQCYDTHSGDSKAWCCSNHSQKIKGNYDSYPASQYTVNGQVACIYYPTYSRHHNHGSKSQYTQRCCVHGPASEPRVNIDQLPDFIRDDVNSVRMGD